MATLGKTDDYLAYTRESADTAIVNALALAAIINRGQGGREVALAITKLQEAAMWLDAAERAIKEGDQA